MPKKKKGESRDKWMARCVPQVIREGKKPNQAVAICTNMFNKKK